MMNFCEKCGTRLKDEEIPGPCFRCEKAEQDRLLRQERKNLEKEDSYV